MDTTIVTQATHFIGEADTLAVARFTANNSALAARDVLLNGASEFESVDTVDDQTIAVQLCADIKAYVNGVEAARKLIKKPVLDRGKLIDRLADEATAKLEQEYTRVTKLIAGFQIKEQARVAEENRIRAEEIARRQAEEQEALEAKARADALLANPAANEADLNRAIAAEQAVKDAEATARAVIVAPLPAAVREAGMAVKPVVKFEVTDIHALYAHNPALVRMEPNKSAINDVIFDGATIPGLRIWSETTVSVRAA